MAEAFFVSSTLMGPDGHTYREPSSVLRTQSTGLIAVSGVFIILGWLTVGLRVYARSVLLKNFGLDDWFMVVALVLFTAQATLFIVCGALLLEHLEPYAAGLTPVSSKLPDLATAGYCLYAATMIAVKFALGFFFLRIFASRPRYVLAIYAGMVIPPVVALATLIYTAAYRCEYEELFFANLRYCTNSTQHQSWLAIAETWTVLNAVSDLLYAALSIIAVMQLRISWKQRAIASILCLLGCVGGVASWVRFGLFLSEYTHYSVLGQDLLQAIWTTIEPGLGITAASMATLRPLLKKLNLGSVDTPPYEPATALAVVDREPSRFSVLIGRLDIMKEKPNELHGTTEPL